MIQIVYGKAKSGKTHELYSNIYHKMSDHSESRQIVLIVPEQFTLEAEKQLIEFGDLKGFIGIEVVSFKRLAYKVLEEIEQIEGVKISEIGQMMLLRRLFVENESKLNVYKHAHNKYGFLTQFYELIKEFKQNTIEPQNLNRVIESLEPESMLANKLSDASVIYTAYEELKEHAFFDEEDFYQVLLERLPLSKKLQDADVYIDGFDSFTGQEYAIINRLAQLSQTLTIAICSDGNLSNPLFAHTNHMFQKIVTMASELNLPIKMSACDWKGVPEDLRHISENLLSYPYQKKDTLECPVSIYSAENRLAEVERCAGTILQLVRDENYTWNDFAVISNAIEQYAPSIKRVFDTYQFPYFIDEKVSVTTHPLVHMIVSYLKMHEERFAPEYTMRFIKSGFFGCDDIDMSAFELIIKQFGIRDKRLEHVIEQTVVEGMDLGGVNVVRERLVRTISPVLKEKKISTESAIRCIYDMLLELDVKMQIDAKVAEFMACNDYEHAQQYAQIWNLTMDLLDQFYTIMADEHLSLSEWIDVLESGFDHMEVGLLPQNEQQVLVGTLDRSKSHPIKVLFVLGMNDGVIPESGNDKQLILDAEKEKLAEMGVQMMADSVMFSNKEIFNIYFALTRPSERLYFSFSRADAEGASLRPSYLITKLQKIAPSLTIGDDFRTPLMAQDKIQSEYAVVKHLAGALRKAIDGYPLADEWRMTFLWFAANQPEVSQLLIEGLYHSNLVEKLDKSHIEAVYQMPLKSSVSRLEQFVLCPFKYFVESGLQLIPQKNYELNAPDIGTLFHGVLEQFGKTIYERKLSWNALSQEQSNTFIDEIVGQYAQKEIFQSRFQYQYLLQKLRRVSKKAAWTLTRQLATGSFEPTAFEVAFGNDLNSAAPITIELKNGEKLLIRGVIDRVDKLNTEERDYIRIIDYKSGNKSLSISDIYNGLQMQLMVYLKACLNNPQYFKSESLEPAGAFYFKIEDQFIESTEVNHQSVDALIQGELKMDGLALDHALVLKGFDAQLYEEMKSSVIQVRIKNDGEFSKDSKVVPIQIFKGLIEHVNRTVSEVGDAILEGEIGIVPCKMKGSNSCSFCDYQTICQFDTSFEGNAYRKIKEYSNDDIFQILKE